MRALSLMTALLLVAGCGKKKESEEEEAPPPGQETGAADFDLTFVGTAFGMHGTETLAVDLMDRTTRESVTRRTLEVPADGAFTTVFSKWLKKGTSYYLSYYADVNRNGKCDAPPLDHTWTVKIDDVQANEKVEQKHRMTFDDSCARFVEGEAPPAASVTVTGTLALGTDVEETGGLTAGQALSGATVFVEGFPDQETRTDETGNFTLQLDLPEGASLDASKYRVLMWYTVPEEGKKTRDWSPASARFGKVQDVSFASGKAKIGKVELTYTKRLTVTVKDKGTGEGIPLCWLRFEGYGFQLVVQDKGAGTYEVDYLPPNVYRIVPVCHDYAEKETTVTVEPATGLGQSQALVIDLDAI